MHYHPKDNEDYVVTNGDFSGFADFQSVKIKEKSKFTLKRNLDSLGINYFTLFPDLDGLTKNIKWEIERDYRYNE